MAEPFLANSLCDGEPVVVGDKVSHPVGVGLERYLVKGKTLG